MSTLHIHVNGHELSSLKSHLISLFTKFVYTNQKHIGDTGQHCEAMAKLHVNIEITHIRALDSAEFTFMV